MNIEMVVGGLMSEPVATCHADTCIKDLVEILSQSRVSCSVVIKDDKPIGIVTERDIVRLLDRFLKEGIIPISMPVSEFMTPSPLCVYELTPLFEALVLTQTHGFRHLPVVDDKDYLIGILTYSDLARAYEKIITSHKKVMDEEVGNKTRYLKEINEHLMSLSLKDALLGIGNRRAMEVDIEYTHKAAQTENGDYSLALFDVDYFKAYNDSYGHQAGDEALKAIVKNIRDSIRSIDRLYRYGGEELLLLMVGTHVDEAEEIANRCVKCLHSQGIEHKESQESVLTMSGGVTSFQCNSQAKWKTIVKNADQALYQAKNSGRNKVVSSCDGNNPKRTGLH